MTRLLTTLLFLTFFSFSQTSLAANYKIELLVFAYSNSEALWQEDWSNNTQLRYPQNLLALNGSGPTTLPEGKTLQGAAEKLNQQIGVRTLFHEAWVQNLSPNSAAIWIRGGQDFGNNKELEGWISVDLKRYLHITTNLWYSQGYANLPVPSTVSNSLGEASFNGGNQVIVMNQKRRMRGGELHYIDNPQLGVLVKIMPL